MSSSKEAEIAENYLTTLPQELLVKIIALLPTKHYLDLLHTSFALRKFILDNSATICNEALRIRFPKEVEFLKCTLKRGWLVPTYEKLLKAEKELDDEEKAWIEPQTLQTKVSRPGPQFLCMLEHKRPVVKICAGGKDEVYLDILEYESALEKLNDVRGKGPLLKSLLGQEDHLKRAVRRDALQVHFEGEIEAPKQEWGRLSMVASSQDWCR